MTRMMLFFAALLIFNIQAALAITEARETKFFYSATASKTADESGTEAKSLRTAGMMFGSGLVFEQGGNTDSKFYHQEDGKIHGFDLERINRRRRVQKIGCFCLKCMLLVLHIGLLIVTYLHAIH